MFKELNGAPPLFDVSDVIERAAIDIMEGYIPQAASGFILVGMELLKRAAAYERNVLDEKWTHHTRPEGKLLHEWCTASTHKYLVQLTKVFSSTNPTWENGWIVERLRLRDGGRFLPTEILGYPVGEMPLLSRSVETAKLLAGVLHPCIPSTLKPIQWLPVR